MKITVAGLGYVGTALAVMLARRNEVTAVDIVAEKVDKINRSISPVKDAFAERFLKEEDLNLTATTDESAYDTAELIIVAAPTNSIEETGKLDTSAVSKVIDIASQHNKNAYIVIKSTIPIGFTESEKKRTGNKRIMFSPEFLREGKALYDCLNPSRIILGTDCEKEQAFKIINVFKEAAESKNIPCFIMAEREAEAVKLFANTYLAARVAYFNELDSFCLENGLNSERIISGMSTDPRIGDFYNNPSFGFGGYCLPKDSKQLAELTNGTLMKAIVKSNKKRMENIRDYIISKSPETVGVFRFVMKAGSDNFRSSAAVKLAELIKEAGIKVIVFEPTVKGKELFGFETENNLQAFKDRSSIILANRLSEELEDCERKVFSRDISGLD